MKKMQKQLDDLSYCRDSKLRIRLDKTTQAGAPIGSKSCNLNCLVCHNDYFSYTDGSVKAIGNRAFANAVRRVIAASQVDQAVVYLAGRGEPTTVGTTELSDLIQVLKEIPKVATVILTTNGVLLAEMAQTLRDAGLDKVRISINSLNEEMYSFCTGRYKLESALAGVEASLMTGLETKINVMYSKLNDREVGDFISLSQRYKGVTVKFFDLLPSSWLGDRLHLSIEQLDTKLGKLARKVLDSRQFYPSRWYMFNPLGVIQVKGFSSNDCPNLTCAARNLCVEDCRDMVRIGLDGIIRPCSVRKDNVVDSTDPLVTERHIREALRSGGKL